MRLSHARSRYIYDLYYKRELISRELYDWLLKQGYADANLIAKWKKNGYEKLCCVRCIQTRDMNFQGSTCICRVPKAQLKKGTVVECPHCGEFCFSVASVDKADWWHRLSRLCFIRLESMHLYNKYYYWPADCQINWNMLLNLRFGQLTTIASLLTIL